MSESDDYIAVLLEDMNSKFDLLIEGQRQILDQKADKSDLAEINDDIRTIKAVVTDNSRQTHDHERRIIKLETQRV